MLQILDNFTDMQWPITSNTEKNQAAVHLYVLFHKCLYSYIKESIELGNVKDKFFGNNRSI